MPMMIKRHNHKGFSLLEMLLTVVIFSGLLLAVFNTLQNYAEQRLARSAANFINQIDIAVSELLADPDNFVAIYNAAAAAPGGIIDIPVNDLINGTGTVPAPVNNLNTNFQITTPWKTGYNIMVRASDNLADANDVPALEVIIATNQRTNAKRVSDAATYSKGKGGFFRGADARIANNVESAFATWNFPVANLNGTDWATAVAADPIPPSFDNGTYYVHYSHYNFDDISGDYLYRQNVAGRPELNRMHTNLDLGLNNILGADDLDPATMSLTAKAIVNGNALVTGNTALRGGNFDTNSTMTTNFATIRGISGGSTANFVNEGNIDTTNSNFSNRVSSTNATFNGGLNTTDDILANDADISGTTTGTNTFADNMITTSGGAPNLNALQVNTSNIDTGTLTASGPGEFGAIDFIASQNAVMQNSFTVQNDLTIRDLDTGTFGACDNGC